MGRRPSASKSEKKVHIEFYSVEGQNFSFLITKFQFVFLLIFFVLIFLVPIVWMLVLDCMQLCLIMGFFFRWVDSFFVSISFSLPCCWVFLGLHVSYRSLKPSL